jgi:hypothetical protein
MNKKQTEAEILLRLPISLCDDIKRLAKQHERSVNKELIWVLRQYVEQPENVARVQSETTKD